MQESFQYGYESVYGKDKSQVLPETDIDKSLSNTKCHSYEMIDDNNEIIVGVIVEINDNNINHLDFLFVRIDVQSKGIGQEIWKEIENIYNEEITDSEIDELLKEAKEKSSSKETVNNGKGI